MDLFALIPLAVLLILILLRMQLIHAVTGFLLTTLALSIVWRMTTEAIGAAIIKGAFIAVDLALIVTGALLFMSLLKRAGLLESLSRHITRISPHISVQTIAIAWFFGSFIEGVAGFGTPAAIVAPLLVGLGFTALRAITIALVANSAAVAFGALGTPITVGLGGANVAATIGVMNLIAFLVPVFILVLIASEGRASVRDALPFAVISGFAFLIPAMIASRFGPAYPSLVGAGVGLLFVVLIARLGWFMPRAAHPEKRVQAPTHTAFESVAPYLVLVAVLILQRFIPAVPVEILGVSHTLPLTNPGIAFFVASALLMRRAAPHRADVAAAATPVLLILMIATAVQIMIRSAENALGLDSMTGSIASLMSGLPIELTAPLLGALGAFFAGSATVSNLLFAPVHLAAGGGIVALASQTLGAAYANMLSLQNIVAVQATVGVEGLERRILLSTLAPAALLLALLIVFGPLLASIV